MVNLLPIASGKGGVGKSSFAVNLAVTLAQKGKSVVLADLDFGGANLHTLLGLKNNHAGLGNFIYKQTDDFSSLLQQTSTPNLQFIAGDCLFPGTANMDYSSKRRIIKNLNALDADYVIMDLGAGTTYNTLDFYLLTYNSILVTTPELTSILNAYSFLKSAVFRRTALHKPVFKQQFNRIRSIVYRACHKGCQKIQRNRPQGTGRTFKVPPAGCNESGADHTGP